MNKLLALCALMALMLVGCGSNTITVDELYKPPEAASSSGNGGSHVSEWNVWDSQDIDFEVPPRVRQNDDGSYSLIGDEGEELPVNSVSSAASDIVAGIEAVGVNNSTKWWQNEEKVYAYYGINDLDELNAVLSEIGLSLEACPVNTVTNGDGFTLIATGTYADNYQIVVFVK